MNLSYLSSNELHGLMKHFFWLCITLILFASCDLNAEQEQRLNSQIGRYMKAYNESRTLELAALTHSSAVKFYHAKGDTAFLNHFHKEAENVDEFEALAERRSYIGDYSIKQVKQSGKDIQCKFSVKVYTAIEELDNDYPIYAISSDEGKTWYFLMDDDYKNKEIKLKRLFKV